MKCKKGKLALVGKEVYKELNKMETWEADVIGKIAVKFAEKGGG